MLTGSQDSTSFDGRALYRIRVMGRLGNRWQDRLGGLEMTIHDRRGESPETELMGILDDQAALMGVLEHLYSRGISIVYVERIRSMPLV